MLHWLFEHWFEIFGALTSLVYLYLEIRQKPQMWILGFLCSFIYVIVFYRSKIYADMSLNVYYMFVSVYGFILWNKNKKNTDEKEPEISYVNLRISLGLILLLLTVSIYFLIAYILDHHTDSPVPYLDSLVTACSITATWMLAKKIIQHWYVWIFVNFLSVYLFYNRALYPTMILFVCYGVMSIIGYLKWKRKI